MEAIYIKHSDDENSLTHYGVKGMKWRKHKAKRDDAYLQSLDEAYAKTEDLYENNKLYRKMMDHYSYDKMSKASPDSRYYKNGVRFGKAWNKGFDSYVAVKAGKKRFESSFNKASNKTVSSAKKSVSKGASFLSKKFGGYRIKTGKMNTVSANGKKHKRYVSVTKNGRPKAFIPY